MQYVKEYVKAPIFYIKEDVQYNKHKRFMI